MARARLAPRTPLAFRLQACVDRLEISYTDLAETLGQKPNNISRWLTGRTAPLAENLAALAEALDTTSEALLRPLTKREERRFLARLRA